MHREILFLQYEELKRDPVVQVKRLASFLEGILTMKVRLMKWHGDVAWRGTRTWRLTRMVTGYEMEELPCPRNV